MSELNLETELRLVMQTALLGEVFPALRCVTCDWGENKIFIKAIIDGEVSDDDRESISCVSTEVIAYFPESFIDFECVRIDSPAPFRCDLLRSTVYSRRE